MSNILFLTIAFIIKFQDLNIPVPPPASAVNEPNAKRQRMDSSEASSVTSEGTRVYALPNGTVPCNKPLSDLIHLVKPHIRELVEDSNLVSGFYVNIINVMKISSNTSNNILGLLKR